VGEPGPGLRQVRSLVGVYNADGTLTGELAYLFGARLGRRHCSLCDITHGMIRPKAEWQACRSNLPVPFDTFHRDEQPEEVRRAADGVVPVVVAHTDEGVIVLLEPDALAECDGSLDRMMSAIEVAIVSSGLCWPTTPVAK
jgi:hypothetical protein